MNVQITIRGVPVWVRDKLAARAASEGKSMEEFLRSELARLATRPSIEEWLEGVRQRKAATDTRVPRAAIVRAKNADKR